MRYQTFALGETIYLLGELPSGGTTADIKIKVMDLALNTVVPLTTSGCELVSGSEYGGSATYMWSSSGFVTQPTARKSYLYILQDTRFSNGRIFKGKFTVGGPLDFIDVAISSRAATGAAMTLAANSITAAVIATDAIDADAIAVGAIDAPVFAAGAINAAAIATGAITAAKFAAGAIDAAAIATDAIDADAIAANAIDAGAIATGAITAAKFAAGAIDAAAIATDAITAAKIAADAIGSSELATTAVDEIRDAVWNALTASFVGAGSMGLKLGQTAVVGSAMTLATNAITALVIATDAIDADAIAVGAIDAPVFAAGAINAAAIATGAITAAKFAAGAIDAAAIATDAIDADAIAANAIDAGAIATGAITAAKFAAGAIDAAAIAADAITAAKIATNAIDADALAADALTEIQTSAQAALTAQGYTTARAPLLDRLDVVLSTRAATGAAMALTGAAISGVADQVWDETLSEHVIVGSTGDALLAAGATGPTAGVIADAVWDEAIAGHLGAGSTGLELSGKAEPGDAMALTAGAVNPTSVATDAIDADALAASALTEIQTSAQAALTAQGYTTGRAPLLDNLNATISSRAIPGDLMGLVADAITAAKIAADAITSAELATTAVDEIVAGVWNALTASFVGVGSMGLKLGQTAVVGSAMTLAAGSITAAVIATDAIDADAIAAGAIDAPVFAAGAINAAAIATGAITAAKFAAGAIDAAAIAADAITAAKIATDAIGSDELAASALTEIQTSAQAALTAQGYTTGRAPLLDNLNATISSRAIPGDLMGLVADAITAAKIAADAITSAELATTAVDEIVAGVWNALTASFVGVGSMGLKLGATAVPGDAMTLAANAITAAVIATDAIDADALAASALTEIQTSAQAALTAQGYTTGRAPLLDNLNATISSRAIPGDLMNLTGAAISGVADQVWDETLADHLAPASTGFALSTASGASPTAGVIADAVWDEAIAGHLGAGSTGLELSGKAEPGDAMDLVTDAVDANSVATDAVTEINAPVLVAVATRAAPGDAMDLVVDAVDAAALAASALTEIQTSAQAALTAQGYTTGRAPNLDNLNATISSRAVPGDAMDLVADAVDAAALAASAVTEINATAVADVQAGLTAQGYTTARAPLLDRLDVVLSTRAATGAAMALTGAAISGVADQVWDEAIADHAVLGSTGEALAAAGATGPTAAVVAAAVWNEPLAGHLGAGSTGLELSGKAEPGDAMDLVVDAVDAAALAASALTEIQTSAQAALTAQGYTTGRAPNLDNLNATISSRAVPGDAMDLVADAVDAAALAASAVTEINATAVADVQAGLTAQGYTTARAPLLDRLDVVLSTRAATGAAMALTGAAISGVADQVWDELLSGHTISGSAGAALASISGLSTTLTASGIGAIADAVWDELLSGHTISGSAGLTLASVSGTVVTPATIADAVWDEAITDHTVSGSTGRNLYDTRRHITNRRKIVSGVAPWLERVYDDNATTVIQDAEMKDLSGADITDANAPAGVIVAERDPV